jgi:hypothetical protein
MARIRSRILRTSSRFPLFCLSQHMQLVPPSTFMSPLTICVGLQPPTSPTRTARPLQWRPQHQCRMFRPYTPHGPSLARSRQFSPLHQSEPSPLSVAPLSASASERRRVLVTRWQMIPPAGRTQPLLHHHQRHLFMAGVSTRLEFCARLDMQLLVMPHKVIVPVGTCSMH